MRRFFYSCAVTLLLPWALLHLWLRSKKQPEYLQHIGERFGHYPPRTDKAPLIWIHAVSVGETRAAEPLITALRKDYPGHRILLTHMTPTGRATRSALLDSCERVYLAYDSPWGVARFLRHFQPSLGLIMETELWPNLIAACKNKKIPLLLVNARLSDRSARRYARFAHLAKQALQQLAAIVAQTEVDAGRLRTLGAPEVSVMGNLKFDSNDASQLTTLGQTWRSLIQRPVILAASTREGEEALIFSAFKAQHSNALLLIVPRHPQRFNEVAALAASQGLKVARRSEALPDPDTQVWIGDSMGEMPAYYALADVAIMGGSLLDFGSQNLIEACAVGTPVLLGPSTYNFAEAATQALLCGAAQQIADAPAAIATAIQLLNDGTSRQAMADAGRQFAHTHRGATMRLLKLIEHTLPPAAGQKTI